MTPSLFTPAARPQPRRPARDRRRHTDARPREALGRKTFALALGVGGARALAHVAVIEALDELGVRPAAIAGTSFGAMIGAAYAAGMTGKSIRHHVIALAHDRGGIFSRLVAARAAPLSRWITAPLGNPVLIDAAKFCTSFLPAPVPDDFAMLSIPLKVVATDLKGRCEIVLDSGALTPALAASMAIPGLVQPVEIDGRIMVDGGAVNPLPFDCLRGLADVVLAVDCSRGADAADGIPDPWEAMFTTLHIMGQAIIKEKLKAGGPDLVIRPPIGIFQMLDFFQASAILRAAEPVKAEVKQRLGALIGA
jgi:NTE family protein